MKKIISTSIIFISLAFASCTNENSIASDKIAFEETKAVTPQEEFSLEVQQINSEIFKLQTEVYNERAITRGFWKNLLKVAFADAIGFFNTGSIRKSAAASTQKAADIYLEEKEKENNKKGQDKGTLGKAIQIQIVHSFTLVTNQELKKETNTNINSPMKIKKALDWLLSTIKTYKTQALYTMNW